MKVLYAVNRGMLWIWRDVLRYGLLLFVSFCSIGGLCFVVTSDGCLWFRCLKWYGNNRCGMCTLWLDYVVVGQVKNTLWMCIESFCYMNNTVC
ncbi:importin beta-like SAD2 isoform X1 [Iris pallida]|uniref:Importin beta-like SAD2 isoform X1 n=1 Tax=Iris pallida TaxID=29817 RepID=A0AAX6E1Z8_IRIPA|nr:importin beta-like SAD2 isoform X1 [Iris pallida]